MDATRWRHQTFTSGCLCSIPGSSSHLSRLHSSVVEMSSSASGRLWVPHRVSADTIKRRPEVAVLAMAERLCKQVVNINSRNRDGDTFLHVACKSGYSETVDYVLEHAAASVDVNALSTGGLTPLAYACRSGHCAIIVRLVGIGAEIDVRNQCSFHQLPNRYLPPQPSEREAAREAIQAGLMEYRVNLSAKLLELSSPFDQLPNDLVPIITDLVCGPGPEKQPPATAFVRKSKVEKRKETSEEEKVEYEEEEDRQKPNVPDPQRF